MQCHEKSAASAAMSRKKEMSGKSCRDTTQRIFNNLLGELLIIEAHKINHRLSLA